MGAEVKFIVSSYALGFLCSGVPNLLMGPDKDFCMADPIDRDHYAGLGIKAIGILCLTFHVLWSIQSVKTNAVVLKSVNWFINAVVTASLIIYAFPVVLINVLFVFPLLFYATPVIKSKISLQWFMNHLFFLAWLTITFSILLGSLLFKDFESDGILMSIVNNAPSVINLLISSLIDFNCVGSNNWLYFCLLLVPNCLVIT